jgi:gas vesicle structural protein
MAHAMQPRSPGSASSPSGLADVIDTILDKGLVIDAYVRVSLVGIELVTIDARIVVASVDTYLRFAEAVNRLDMSQDKQGLPELFSKENTARNVTKGVLEGVGEKLREFTEPETKRSTRRSR